MLLECYLQAEHYTHSVFEIMSDAADVKPDVKPAADGAEGNTITIRVRDQVTHVN